MIGVITKASEQELVREFFELFKTPWEFYRNDRQYDVLLVSAGDAKFQRKGAKLVLIYSGEASIFNDVRESGPVSQCNRACTLYYRTNRLPIYGASVTFGKGANDLLIEEETHEPAIHLRQSEGQVCARIGYDLFSEMRTLLTSGQPVACAGIPTLELHIALLRELILASGLSVTEIPPVPDGYRFIACLTHDVDHPSIRRHKFDHTIAGFLFRAILGSVTKVIRRRMTWRHLLANWVAVFKLPFVHLGIAKDFWYDFDDYTKLETGVPSSYFVIPMRGYAGRKRQGTAPSRRAAGYAACDIAEKLQKLASAKCEIGLHGIDAWMESSKAIQELEHIRRITGKRAIGVRMHWLYFDEHSPSVLDQAGADYDSTAGYNETIGYQAGTCQVYKPLGVSHLLELPLHIMDTAMFFPGHLALSFAEARKRVTEIIANAVRFGGVVTVNWHDRSIAPERLWGEFYLHLLAELKKHGAWFATASDAVKWFRKRRLVTFEDGQEPNELCRKMAEQDGGNLPALCLRVHRGSEGARVATNENRRLHDRDFSAAASLNWS